MEGGSGVLSQLCRMCQGNYAGRLAHICSSQSRKSAFPLEVGRICALTILAKTVILGSRTFLAREFSMSDEKLKALRQSHTLHPHPEQVRDPLFTSGSAFFDPRDLVQVKYELLRRVQVEGDSVSHAAWLRESQQLIVHPRSIERALARAAKKGGSR